MMSQLDDVREIVKEIDINREILNEFMSNRVKVNQFINLINYAKNILNVNSFNVDTLKLFFSMASNIYICSNESVVYKLAPILLRSIQECKIKDVGELHEALFVMLNEGVTTENQFESYLNKKRNNKLPLLKECIVNFNAVVQELSIILNDVEKYTEAFEKWNIIHQVFSVKEIAYLIVRNANENDKKISKYVREISLRTELNGLIERSKCEISNVKDHEDKCFDQNIIDSIVNTINYLTFCLENDDKLLKKFSHSFDEIDAIMLNDCETIYPNKISDEIKKDCLYNCELVSELTNDNIFWIRIKDNESITNHLINELSEEIEHKISKKKIRSFSECRYEPDIYEMCFCFDIKISKFLRGQIEGINTKKKQCKVRFLDLGFVGWNVSYDRLFLWREFKLNKIPFQSLQCCLASLNDPNAGVSHMDNRSFEYLKFQKLKCILKENMIGKNNLDCWLIDLYRCTKTKESTLELVDLKRFKEIKMTFYEHDNRFDD